MADAPGMPTATVTPEMLADEQEPSAPKGAKKTANEDQVDHSMLSDGRPAPETTISTVAPLADKSTMGNVTIRPNGNGSKSI